MRLLLPTHSINYTNGVNCVIPLYWELWQNGYMIKNLFTATGGMYNDIKHENWNNHPASSEIDVPTGFGYTYTFKMWNLGKVKLPMLLVAFYNDTQNSNNISGTINGAAYQLEAGGYKQFDCQFVDNPNGAKFNCNAGFVKDNGEFEFQIKPPLTLFDITGTNTPNAVVEKLAHRIKDNVSLEWYNKETGLFTGARIPNTKTLAGVDNPYYINPVVLPPSTNIYYNFNAGDYFDFNKNPAARSPISFAHGYGAADLDLAIVRNNLLKRYNTTNSLEMHPFLAGVTVSKTVPSNIINPNTGQIEGWLYSKTLSSNSLVMIFKNPLNSRAGCRIKVKKHPNFTENSRVTVKSSLVTESVQTTAIDNDLLHIIDYGTFDPVAYIYVFVEGITNVGMADEPIYGLNISCEFYSENNGEIPEPYFYKEDAGLFLVSKTKKEAQVYKKFETFVSTTDIADLTTIAENLWQQSLDISIPSAGVYYVYGKVTLNNDTVIMQKIRSFTQN